MTKVTATKTSRLVQYESNVTTWEAENAKKKIIVVYWRGPALTSSCILTVFCNVIFPNSGKEAAMIIWCATRNCFLHLTNIRSSCKRHWITPWRTPTCIQWFYWSKKNLRAARAYVTHIFSLVPLHYSLRWQCKVEILPRNEYEPTAVALAIILHSLFLLPSRWYHFNFYLGYFNQSCCSTRKRSNIIQIQIITSRCILKWWFPCLCRCVC